VQKGAGVAHRKEMHQPVRQTNILAMCESVEKKRKNNFEAGHALHEGHLK